MGKTVIRYSEAFKLKVVNELESGKLSCVYEARIRYGIRGCGTIECWLRKYGKNHLLCKVVKVKTVDEKDELKKQKARIKQLEKALADAHLDLIIEKEYFKMACEAGNISDPDEFKKKTKFTLTHRIRESCSSYISLRTICNKVGMSRQNYYKERKRHRKKEIDTNLMIELVKNERRQQSRLGGRKVLNLIKRNLNDSGISIGRDRFFNVLRENGLLIEKKKSTPKTTNSRHCLPVFHNLVKDAEITEPNQAWCSDLTYIRTDEDFMYAALITDMYSRKIVGAYIGDSLESTGCLIALDKALNNLPKDKHPIHHSDRGCQYCCHSYVDRLTKKGLTVSMTEINHCYENAMAERVNGILKQEYELDHTFKTKEQARVAFYQAVELYNTRRPHMSLNYRVPAEVHKNAA